jgi:WD40 repeat protein
MAPDAIYTASRDKKLKRWKTGTNPSTNRFELTVDLEVDLGDLCWCMVMAGEWIFCGLGDGTIKGYSKSGGQAVMKGHSKRVQVLKLHQHVLISGSSDGSVRLWQADPTGQSFACTNTITEGLSSGVACLAVLAEHLWVGGTSGVAIVELASLRVVSQIQPKKFVAGFQEFQGHMIVAYADGQVCIFDAGGVKKHDQAPMEAGPILSVAGLESGPRLLLGHAKGQVTSMILPAFTLRVCWQAFEKCKVQSICCSGQDGVFIIGGENGNLQLWQRDSSVP